MHRFFEEVDKGETAFMAAVDELFATDYVEHGGTGEDTIGIKNYKRSMNEFFQAFADVHVTLDDVVAEGDKVAVRFTLSGLSPAKKKWTIGEIGIIRIAGDKFVESWMRYDTLGWQQQLGLMPPPGKG